MAWHLHQSGNSDHGEILRRLYPRVPTGHEGPEPLREPRLPTGGSVKEIPKWMMRDPSMVAEQLERMRMRDDLTPDQSDTVEDLLQVWYDWARAHREHLGYSRVSPMFRGAESSEVHDDGEARDQR